MTVVLLLLATLLVVLGILLFTPLRYNLYLQSLDTYEVKFFMGWLGKLFRIRLQWRSGEPYLFEAYAGGKLRAGTAKEYQAWLAQQVQEELHNDPEKERDYLFTEEDDQATDKPDKGATAAVKGATAATDTSSEPSEEEEKTQGAGDSSSSKAKKQLEKLKALNWSWLAEQVFSWEFQSALFTMLTDMYNHSKPRFVKIEGSVGTGDPAYTAMLQGFLYTRSLELWGPIEFDYLEATCRGTFEMRGEIVPARMAWYGLRFALSRPARDVLQHIGKGLLKGGK